MRIVGGEFGSRRLVAPAGRGTRPSSDRLRGALFAALQDVTGARALDLFAGSGALGLEALSRGAASCDFVERDRAALAALEANVDALGLGTRGRILAGDVRAVLRRLAREGRRYDLVLIDPPYRLVQALTADLDRWLPRIAAPACRVAYETGDPDGAVLQGFRVASRRRVGRAALTLLVRTEDAP
jgi:16S rRNA (guanine966-N2)-methyltransferase